MNFLVALASILMLASAGGTSEYENKGRIGYGVEANSGELPYVVAIESFGEVRGICAGALISKNWILTAAHCVYIAYFVQVYLGSIYRSQCEIGYAVWKSDFVIHPCYDDTWLQNDLALIKIPETKTCDHIKPIPLPRLVDAHENYVGQYGVCSGWGLTENGRVSTRLQWTFLKIVNCDICKILSDYVTDANLCIYTHNGRKPNQGDSGGPLESSGRLIGVLSANLIRERPSEFFVFMRIGYYLEWIKSVAGVWY